MRSAHLTPNLSCIECQETRISWHFCFILLVLTPCHTTTRMAEERIFLAKVRAVL